MFELLEDKTRWTLPRPVAISGAILGGFAVGLATGKLLMEAKPVVDWTMTIRRSAGFGVLDHLVCDCSLPRQLALVTPSKAKGVPSLKLLQFRIPTAEAAQLGPGSTPGLRFPQVLLSLAEYSDEGTAIVITSEVRDLLFGGVGKAGSSRQKRALAMTIPYFLPAFPRCWRVTIVCNPQ